MADQLYGLTASDVRRIKSLLSQGEGASRATHRGPDAPSMVQASRFHIAKGTFTGTWPSGTTKTVSTYTGDVTAKNYFSSITGPSAPPGKECIVAWTGIEWALVAPFSGAVILAKTSADWAKGTTATLPIYGGSSGSESETGESIVAMNYFGKVLAGKWCLIGQTTEGGAYLIAPEADQVELVYAVEIVGTTVNGVTTSKLVFRRKKVWVHSIEEGTPVELPLAECVEGYTGV